MAKPFLNVAIDTKQMTRLQAKLSRYGEAAIQQGLKDTEAYLNEDEFKLQMYPTIPAGTPFQWSSEKQRRAYFATDGFGGGIPYKRTHELMQSGTFHVNSGSLWIEYRNTAPYSRWVINPMFQIIGHIKRGWKPINVFVVAKSKQIASIFQKATKKAWTEMDKFIYGGGAGL